MVNNSNSCLTCELKNARFRCANCKSVWYCSRQCQESNWKSHKQSCINESNKLVSIVIVNGIEAFEHKIPKMDLDSKNLWFECSMTEMIGVPVKVKRWEPYKSKPEMEVGKFLLTDPVTGQIPYEWKNQWGIIAFARQDNTDMSVKLFWDLYSYIHHLTDYYVEDDFDFKSFKKNKLNYESFRTYRFREHRLQGLVN